MQVVLSKPLGRGPWPEVLRTCGAGSPVRIRTSSQASWVVGMHQGRERWRAVDVANRGETVNMPLSRPVWSRTQPSRAERGDEDDVCDGAVRQRRGVPSCRGFLRGDTTSSTGVSSCVRGVVPQQAARNAVRRAAQPSAVSAPPCPSMGARRWFSAPQKFVPVPVLSCSRTGGTASG